MQIFNRINRRKSKLTERKSELGSSQFTTSLFQTDIKSPTPKYSILIGVFPKKPRAQWFIKPELLIALIKYFTNFV